MGNNEFQVLPALPLKNTILFPGLLLPLSVGRDQSMRAVQAALKTEEKEIVLIAQRDAQTESPQQDDLYTIGTKAVIANHRVRMRACWRSWCSAWSAW
jgi:ATP-dependent Lon protease